MSSFPENLADRFRRFKQRHFLPNAEQYEELATFGQTPEAMIISCSDSRVDPNSRSESKSPIIREHEVTLSS